MKFRQATLFTVFRLIVVIIVVGYAVTSPLLPRSVFAQTLIQRHPYPLFAYQTPTLPPLHPGFGIAGIQWVNYKNPIGSFNLITGATSTLRSSNLRYKKARDIGPQWTRTVLWWYMVEPYQPFFDGDYFQPYPESFSEEYINLAKVNSEYGYCLVETDRPDPPDVAYWVWDAYDELLANLAANNLETVLVLQGIPRCHQPRHPNPDPGKEPTLSVPSIESLENPIFQTTTGTTDKLCWEANSRCDVSEVVIGINRENPWAYFVYHAVLRYGDQVKYWQVWNEQNDPMKYWPPQQGCEDLADCYARLLEVTFWAAEYAQCFVSQIC
jgi:hypothetical protein